MLQLRLQRMLRDIDVVCDAIEALVGIKHDGDDIDPAWSIVSFEIECSQQADSL